MADLSGTVKFEELAYQSEVVCYEYASKILDQSVVTGLDGLFTFTGLDAGKEYFVVSLQLLGEKWLPTHTYSIGDLVRPTGDATGLTFQYTTGGLSSATEPVWPTIRGDSLTDGVAVLEAMQLTKPPVVLGPYTPS